MKNIMFAILNWDRDPKIVLKNLIQRFPVTNNITVCTNQINEWKKINFKGTLIEADKSIAKSKNKILLSMKPTDEYCVIFEDDVQILNSKYLKNYISLMNEFNLGFINYGYATATNRVLDQKPNPCIIMNDGNGRELYFHRHMCSSVLFFKRSMLSVGFDENLKCLEHEFLIEDLVKHRSIPFNGFLLDIEKSWEYFGREKTFPNLKKRTQEDIMHDINLRGGSISLNHNADEVINYVSTIVRRK